jgi:small subunit ribosomal protein S2
MYKNKLYDFNILSRHFIKAHAHLGLHKQKRHILMNQYIYKTINQEDTISLDKTIQQLRLTLNAIQMIIQKHGTLIVILPKLEENTLITQNTKITQQNVISERWKPGHLSNAKTIFKKLKNITQKFTKYSKPLRSKKYLPNLAIVFNQHNNNNQIIINETNSLRIPSILLSNTNTNPLTSTYFIPTNTKTHKTKDILVALFNRAVHYGYAKAIYKFKYLKKNIKYTKNIRITSSFRKSHY